ncbi:DUF1059 domain-containing protein [Pseudokineococcus basanitobsidens]|uniref:DUF1059 domain-containing protein n=1 Tax=Pseudokineococcus basanitobsidens TaxID=1926649 RepID=A0ABU8RLV9_9ACTN
MKAFRCGDVVPGCSETFRGETAEEVLQDVVEHASRDHGVTVDDALEDEVLARVRES